MPFNVASSGLTWTASNRPVIGTTQLLQMGNVRHADDSIVRGGNEAEMVYHIYFSPAGMFAPNVAKSICFASLIH